MFNNINYFSSTFISFQTKSQVPTTVISSQSNDYVLDLLGTTEEKLVKLVEELEAKDLEGTLKEMRQLDVNITVLPINL